MTDAIATPNASPLAPLATGTAYDAAAHASATRAAYTTDAQCWGRYLEGQGVNATDANPQHVAAYLAHLADTGHAAATIDRRLVAIRALYRAAGLPDPTKHDAVARTRRGIRRTIGTAQREARPVLLEDLTAMLRTLPAGLLGARDRALLLVGFAGAFRRAELAAIRTEDLAWSDRGVVVTLRRSKTDQEGAGRGVAIPFARVASRCPVRALRAWLEAAGIVSGPVFRSVNRHGQVSAQAITPKTVALVVKRAGDAAGIDADHLSGHSLRAGLATAAAMAGADERSIMQQTGHRSTAMVRRYIRQAEQWTNNAAGAVL
jgi:integrase